MGPHCKSAPVSIRFAGGKKMRRCMVHRVLDIRTIAIAMATLTLWAATAAVAQQQKPTNPQLPDPNSQGQQQPASPSTSSPATQSGQQGSQLSTQENGQGQISSQNQQIFIGRIVKGSDRLVLKDRASNTTYQLDRQDLAKHYDGKNVRVTGTLDKEDKTIHVSTIEPLSS